jgi:class 3 adenylate cyclase
VAAGLGLERYEPAFRDNGIDAEVLPKLTVEDLRDIGVIRVGDRRKLLEAVAALRVGAAPSPVAEQPSEVAGPAAPRSTEAERRQQTVMFCDLVGSTARSARLEPEDLRAGSYHRCVAAVIESAGGFVAKYMGDSVPAYFGYPPLGRSLAPVRAERRKEPAKRKREAQSMPAPFRGQRRPGL